MVVAGYIEGDAHIIEFINECKEKYKLQGKPRRTKSLKLQRAGNQLSEDLALKKDEIENIFDILENDV
jgi:phage protein U